MKKIEIEISDKDGIKIIIHNLTKIELIGTLEIVLLKEKDHFRQENKEAETTTKINP